MSQQASSERTSRYGTCGERSALARRTADGWQVKRHDPRNRLAGHDGWVLLGAGWPDLAAACAATGMQLVD